MRLILIRHLQTDYNRRGILQGKQDIPILAPSAEVLLQIEKNKAELVNYEPFDAILISEFQRTLMTAQHYGYSKQQLKVEKLLNELDFGDFEGQTKADLIAEHGDLWENTPQLLTLGEPLTQLENRIHQFIETYKDKQNILVFGHGSWLRALDSIFHHENIQNMNQITIANNILLQFNFDDKNKD